MKNYTLHYWGPGVKALGDKKEISGTSVDVWKAIGKLPSIFCGYEVRDSDGKICVEFIPL